MAIADSTAFGLSSGLQDRVLPIGGIKDSGLGYKEGIIEVMTSFRNIKTYSLPWPD